MTTSPAVTGTRFHRLARESTTFEHWRLPVAAILSGLVYVIVTVVMLIGVVVIVAVAAGSFTEVEPFLDRLMVLDDPDPWAFAVLMLSVIAMAPCVWLLIRLMWPEHTRYLLSVEGRVRWGWLLRCGLLSLVVIGATLGFTLVVSGGDGSLRPFTGRSALMLVFVVLLTPLQSAAEEYVFRGFGLQLVGSWVRSPLLPIVVTTVVFVAGHVYELWGLVDVGVFGLAAAWMTVRTGGLEAAVAAHVVNNVLLFGLGIAGLIDLEPDDPARPEDVLPTLILSALLVAWVEFEARRTGLVTSRAPQPQSPRLPAPPVVPPMPPSVGYRTPPLADRAAPVVPPNAPPYPGELTDGWR